MYNFISKNKWGTFRRQVPNAEYKFCIVYLFRNKQTGELEVSPFKYTSWTSKKSYIRRVAITDDIINYGADSFQVFDCELENKKELNKKAQKKIIEQITNDPLERIIGENIF